MGTQNCPITEPSEIHRKAYKIVVENEGKHPCGSTSLLYLPRYMGRTGLRLIEGEYKEIKVKAAVKLFQDKDPVMKMVRDFKKCA